MRGVQPRFHVMVMGSQRSGTNALFYSLTKDSRFTALNEIDPRAFDNYFLKKRQDLEPLLVRPCILKPISESKIRRIEDVLDEFHGYEIKVIWIFRNPVNVYQSSFELWQTPLDEFIGRWNHRNRMVVDVRAAYRDRVWVVRYEDLIYARRLFTSLCKQTEIRGKYLFRPDSQKGIKTLPPELQDQITQETSKVLAQMEEVKLCIPGGASRNVVQQAYRWLKSRLTSRQRT